MSSATLEMTGRELRFLADNYEQAQTLRRSVEERIRAVVQGRDETFVPLGTIIPDDDDEPVWIDEHGEARTAAETLEAIRATEVSGPVPMLGRSYRRYWLEERETFRDMRAALDAHPAWPWLEQVRGMGPTLACKLLARLDPEKAPYASSFWSYCGLGTVPGERYKCPDCGRVRGFPVGYNVTGKHSGCEGKLEKIAGPEDGVRVAQPKAARGEKSSYDKYAKKVCYLVGTSFLKAGGPYEEFYRRERAKVEVEKPGWADGRKHYKALRKTEKLFLSHLWQVWREALGMPTPDPWAQAHGGHDPEGKIKPGDMVE